ncbi:peptide ABC transporter substrate-binding protein [Ligilactobacillus agilis]|uniref:Peptide ABC transporter substrate-binding protein n=1 Tax=Ligilactobacillus agilis TaxID=1601 RepID=A0A226R9P7_9LACO|nr:peptide ABC transporter substrate-binding protein [Ligilactobacillus agilis]MBL1056711.1 peptide ABC transporter substrate-binding protein [Ligilactobacillus agilis]OXC07033.1 peptide ABC transporter substrate-binding protein [Ligilactobacillus agilis]OXC07425.1 peptide ABC transporter substrate-binding protein [Ligilactobacillus agilis]OXC12208.1 peptide ABC transporter substrate-binding protein [Ligilactobacillus agilis]OXS39605.1 peptide ABC transporter substrate-binding protein [Ligilac
MQKKKIVGLVMALGLAGLFLTACGKQQTTSKQQELRLSASAPLDTIDISKATGYGQTGNVFESFYRLGKNGQPTAGLAKKATVSADGLTWTFTLRDAKWSNGDQITAQDFVYSWRRSLTPKTASPYAYLFSGVKNADAISKGKLPVEQLGIKALDNKTVEISLEKPIAYFKVLMAYPLFGPQNQKVVEKYGKKYATNSKYMVYSGPFVIKDWTGTSDKWSFQKNPNYWDKKQVKLDKISYKVVSNPNTGYELYQQGKLDMTPLSSQQVKNYKNSSEFKQYPYSYVAFLAYNFNATNAANKKALNNQNIRRALSLALDRKVLTKKVFGDGSQVPTGFVANDLAKNPQTGVDFSKEQAVTKTVAYDANLAQKYWRKGLAETGLKELTFNILASSDTPTNDALTQYLQSQYTKVLPGLKVKVQNIPGKSALERARKGEFDIYVSGWGGDFNDPITFLQIPLTGTSYNYGNYSNSEYDRLIAKATNEDANDKLARWNDLVAAAKLFNSQQGVSPLYQQTTAYLQKKRVKGIIHNTAGTQWNYKYAYLK